MRRVSAHEMSHYDPLLKRRAAEAARLNRKMDSATRSIVTKLSKGRAIPTDFDVAPMAVETARHLLASFKVPHSPNEYGPELRRIMLSPSSLTPDQLNDYISELAESACAALEDQPKQLISPCLVPHLTRGLMGKPLNDAVYNALEIIEAYPAHEEPCFERALLLVGFGTDHVHNLEAHPKDTTYKKLNQFQVNWLSIPEWSDPLDYLLEFGAAQSHLATKLCDMREKIISLTNRLLTPGAHKYSISTYMQLMTGMRTGNEADYAAACDRLFRQEWDLLHIRANPASVTNDIEVIMARLILCELLRRGNVLTRKPVTLSSQYLVGISLLTGVSLAKWAQFAVADLNRRGESFTTSEELAGAMEIIEGTELQPLSRCDSQVYAAVQTLKYPDPHRAMMARRLRKARNPLWSVTAQSLHKLEDGAYLFAPERLTETDGEQYKEKVLENEGGYRY